MTRATNPVESHRKSEHQRQVKKAKAERQKQVEEREKAEKERLTQERQEKRKQELIAREIALAKGKKIRNPKRSIYYDPIFNPFGNPPPEQPYLEYPTSEELEEIKRHEERIAKGESDDEEDFELDIPLPMGDIPIFAKINYDGPLPDSEDEKEYERKANDSNVTIIAPKPKLKPAPPESVTISAEPVLRDLKAERMKFIPTTVRKKVSTPSNPK